MVELLSIKHLNNNNNSQFQQHAYDGYHTWDVVLIIHGCMMVIMQGTFGSYHTRDMAVKIRRICGYHTGIISCYHTRKILLLSYQGNMLLSCEGYMWLSHEENNGHDARRYGSYHTRNI